MIDHKTKKLRVNHNEWILGLLLLLLVILVRLPSIPQPFDNDSGASAYHAQLILQGEPLYGTHHPGHVLPGIYYTYAFVFSLFGKNTQALKIFLIGWVWVNSWLMFQIGKRVKDWPAGVFAAIFFILASASTAVAGDTGETEMFANLPITLTIWLGIELIRKRSHPLAFTLVGISGAISFLYKPVYISSLASICLGLFLFHLMEYSRKSWLELAQKAIAILLGVLLVFGLVIAYFTSVGFLSRFLLAITLGSEYISQTNTVPFYFTFLIAPILLARANIMIVLLGIYGAIRQSVTLPQTLKSDRNSGIISITILLWLITSIVAAGFSKLSFPHYSLLALPPLALLSSIEISTLFINFQPNQFVLTSRKVLIGIALLLAVLITSIFSARDYIGGFLRYSASQISLEEFVSEDTMMGIDRINAVHIAEYIQTHTNLDDYIFNWTDEAEIYFLSGRRSSSDSILPIYISRLGPPERVFTAKPKYILVGRVLMTGIYFDRNVIPNWLLEELTKSYQLETTLGNHQIYRRNRP